MILPIVTFVMSALALGLSILALAGVGRTSMEMVVGLGRVIMALRRVDGLPETPPDMKNPLVDVGRKAPRRPE